MVGFLDRLGDPERMEALTSLETWASDNIAFPAAAYVRYIEELYQENRLIRGTHVVRGRAVDLSAITCPVMTVTTARDVICPPPSALALNAAAGSSDKRHVAIPGGHVGAVVGEKARSILYPALAAFFQETRQACSSIN
jgi:polyhydroxyalkanoate synthase